MATCVFVAPSRVEADEVTLSPRKDNTLYQDPTGSLSSGAGVYFYVGRNTQPTNFLRRGLLAFDLGGIQAGSTIESATLTLAMSRTIAAAKEVRLHRVTADWGEGSSDAESPFGGRGGDGTAASAGDATWLHRFHDPPQLWAAPGGDFVGQASAAAQVGGAGAYTWGSTPGMVADVQSWLDDPAGNFGWILIGDESAAATTKRFGSRENSAGGERPRLTLRFRTPPTLTLSPDPVRVGHWGRELVSASLRDAEGRGIPGIAVDFRSQDPTLAWFPYPRAFTDADGTAYALLETERLSIPEDLRTSFTASSTGVEAGPVPVEGTSLVSDGPAGFEALPLGPFAGDAQKLAGNACGLVSPEDVGRAVGAWSIDPRVAEIDGGIVAAFLDPSCERMEFDVVAHRPGTATFIIGTVDLAIYETEVVFDQTLFRRGDSNADGTTDMSDAVAILGFLFLGTTMNDCKNAADVNDDGNVDLSDPVRLLGFLFVGAERPPDPFGDCGVDPTADDLDCNVFSKCP